ncbi:MAG: hypothetical protein MSC31_13050 [Solirubrobacteraceae bacterium MAG38_C4-C5]|nr:hypothetical protein [Candidatus Siliceabacter maunaloa]
MSSGRQNVFAGSVAQEPVTQSAPATQAAGGRSTADSVASPAPARSATGNLWSGFATEESASLSAAEASAAPQSDGLGSQAISMAVLALGLTGLVGGLLVTAARRQRVQFGRNSERNER